MEKQANLSMSRNVFKFETPVEIEKDETLVIYLDHKGQCTLCEIRKKDNPKPIPVELVPTTRDG